MKTKKTVPSTQHELLEHYTAESRRRYSAGIEGIIEFGKCLIEAKAKLEAETWKQFTETDRCPVTYTVATRYMRIAESPHILNSDNWKYLPLGWNALYEISLLEESEFQAAIVDGKIKPGLTRLEAHQLHAKKERSMPRTRSVVPSDNAPTPQPDPGEIERLASVFDTPAPGQPSLHEEISDIPVSAEATVLAKRSVLPSVSRRSTPSNVSRTYRLSVVVTTSLSDMVQQLKREIESSFTRLGFDTGKVDLCDTNE